jgi:hypothetical protein
VDDHTILLITMACGAVVSIVEPLRLAIDEYRHYRAARTSAATPSSAPRMRWRIVTLLSAFLVVVVAVIAYPKLSAPPVTPAPPPAPTAFTPAWLTPERHNTFRVGAGSIILASGNMPPTRMDVVAEPESSKFASTLADMFLLSGFSIQTDDQGNRVGIPTTHRLTPGITIVAPVPSLAAEALRIGLERIGIQTRRSTDHSRTGDYLIVEVGPAP